jgi:hypothetical protein
MITPAYFIPVIMSIYRNLDWIVKTPVFRWFCEVAFFIIQVNCSASKFVTVLSSRISTVFARAQHRFLSTATRMQFICPPLKTLSHYMPGHPLVLQQMEALRISWQSAHEGGKVVSPTHWPPYHPWGIPATHSC